MVRPGRIIVVLGLLALSACTHGQRTGSSRSEPEEGEASFYSASLEGRPTASGELYRGEALTCAHRTHPFGAQLEITNLENRRVVIVRVNDRGPFVRGRIVDLSLAAARALDMVERGVVRVRVRPLRRPGQAMSVGTDIPLATSRSPLGPAP
ncbi:MAG: septal ring lytic transglycosylase RlpA family protein [Myxococcales bacterium]